MLACWDEVQSARAAGDWDAVLSSLTALRKSISTQGKKDNWDDIDIPRAAMSELRQVYDENLKFLAEKSRFSLDEKIAADLPAIQQLFEQVLAEYQRRKDERQALDFDDLEGITTHLLIGNFAVCARLRGRSARRAGRRIPGYQRPPAADRLRVDRFQSAISSRNSKIG